MEIRWDPKKSNELKLTRGMSFEEIIQTNFVATRTHSKKANQQILLFEFQDYIWVVPCVINKDEIFLKTLFPSRKITKLWKEGKL